jgi:hypothetical protein
MATATGFQITSKSFYSSQITLITCEFTVNKPHVKIILNISLFISVCVTYVIQYHKYMIGSHEINDRKGTKQ